MSSVETVRGPVAVEDLGTTSDFFSGEAEEAALAQAAPNWRYEHIHHDVLPALREQGVTDEQLTTMLVENPRRYFAGA